MAADETFSDAELRAAYAVSGLIEAGIPYEQAGRDDALLICLRNMARAAQRRAERDTTRPLASLARRATIPRQLPLEDA